jgi:hypothetical protein
MYVHYVGIEILRLYWLSEVVSSFLLCLLALLSSLTRNTGAVKIAGATSKNIHGHMLCSYFLGIIWDVSDVK